MIGGGSMIKPHELKEREQYLNKLIGFQDTEPIKVVTGIRRCGKYILLIFYGGNHRYSGAREAPEREEYSRPRAAQKDNTVPCG